MLKRHMVIHSVNVHKFKATQYVRIVYHFFVHLLKCNSHKICSVAELIEIRPSYKTEGRSKDVLTAKKSHTMC